MSFHRLWIKYACCLYLSLLLRFCVSWWIKYLIPSFVFWYMFNYCTKKEKRKKCCIFTHLFRIYIIFWYHGWKEVCMLNAGHVILISQFIRAYNKAPNHIDNLQHPPPKIFEMDQRKFKADFFVYPLLMQRFSKSYYLKLMLQHRY